MFNDIIGISLLIAGGNYGISVNNGASQYSAFVHAILQFATLFVIMTAGTYAYKGIKYLLNK